MSAGAFPGGSGPGPGVGGSGPLSIKERRRLNPSRLSSALLSLAVRALPPAHRARYEREFYAELFGMSRARQGVYCLALVVNSTRLAFALDDRNPVEMVAGRDWRCRLRWHHDVVRNNPDAETPEAAFYRQCTRCGRITDKYQSAPHWLSASGS